MKRKRTVKVQSTNTQRTGRRWWLWAVVGCGVLTLFAAAVVPPAEDSPAPAVGDVATVEQVLSEATPPPALTESPEDVVVGLAEDALSGDVLSVAVHPAVPSVVIEYMLISESAGYATRQMARLVCDLREVFPGYLLLTDGKLPVVDAFGNEDVVSGLGIRLEAATIEAINCENVEMVDLSLIADRYSVDRLMNE